MITGIGYDRGYYHSYCYWNIFSFFFKKKKEKKERKKNITKIGLYISYIAYVIPLSFKVPDIFKYPGLLN
jgi:hypothetical protein